MPQQKAEKVRKFIDDALAGGWLPTEISVVGGKTEWRETGFGYDRLWMIGENGYEGWLLFDEMLLDSKAWNAVGRIRNWDKKVCSICGRIVNEKDEVCENEECREAKRTIVKPRPLYYMHKMVESIWYGGTKEDFIVSL